MGPFGSRTLAVVLAAIAAGVAPGVAQGDFYAITETHPANGSLDLVRVDLSTGQDLPLPDGVNTGADEFHPSLSPDGTRLAFERVNTAAGTTRIVVTNLGTGISADLLTAFQVPTIRPNDPTWISPSAVALGQPLVQSGAAVGDFRASFTSVGVSAFPSGPFPLSGFGFPQSLPVSGRSLQLDDHGSLTAGIRFDSDPRGEVLSDTAGGVHTLAGADSFDDPTVSTSQSVIVMERTPITPTGHLGTSRLVFTPLSLASPIDLPQIVSSGLRPELSDDGRYLAFVGEKDGGDQLRIWDTQTQLLLPDVTVNLGPHDVTSARGALLRTDGAIVLHRDPLILSSSLVLPDFHLNPNLQLNLNLALPSNIGIIVQKVVGRTRVLGHPAPKLRFVGRVPLGHFRKGRSHIRWDRRVNGRVLAPGEYQITTRSLTPKGGIRDLGRPVLIRLRAIGRRRTG